MTQANTRPGTMHSVTPDLHQDLMAGPPPTHLPADPAQAELDAGTRARRRRTPPPRLTGRLGRPGRGRDRRATATRSPSTPTPGSATTARLDLLRRNGWKGHGPVPWEHEPNRGFLTCLGLLALAAKAIGETDEWDRCSAFLRDSSPAAYDVLLAGVE